MRLYHKLDKECSARAGILNNNPVRKLGKNTKMPTASSMPTYDVEVTAFDSRYDGRGFTLDRVTARFVVGFI